VLNGALVCFRAPPLVVGKLETRNNIYRPTGRKGRKLGEESLGSIGD
jgi:hypothetical protein